jgi:hypothetical protein
MEHNVMAEEKSTQDQVNDLANRVGRSTVAVIDAITQRGGFKGEELSTIGSFVINARNRSVGRASSTRTGYE